MARRMVVVAATWSDSPVSLMMRGLSRRFEASGRSVRFLAARHGALPPGTEGISEIRAWPGSFRSARAVVFAWRALDGRPAAVLANFSAVNLLVLFGWVRRVPVRIAWYRTLAAALDLDNGPLAWYHRIPRLRKRLIYRLATTVVVSGAASADDLHRAFGVPRAKIRVEPNLVPEPTGGPVAAPPSDEVPEVVCVARLFPVKDHATILDAFARMEVPARLVLLGDGPCRGDLEERAASLGIAGQVEFAGVVPHAEVTERLRSAAATVLATRSESFGLAVVEAMALGVPVIASRVCDLPAMVGEGPGAGGLLFEPGDVAGLAAHLDRLVASPSLRAEMAAAARSRFEARYSLEQHLGAAATRLGALIDARVAG